MKHLIFVLSLLFVLASAPAVQAAPAAVVQSLTPEAWATSSQGQRQELQPGSQLQEQDSLHTGSSGRLNVRFSDGTELMLQSSTSVDIADYVFEENASFSLNIVGGAATLISGAIVEQNPEGFRVNTPLGTVGIRGTTLFISVSNDKVSIVVTEMSAGHSVTVMGLDGNSVSINEPGMQVDLIRGEPTPASADPAGPDSISAIENPEEEESYAELPHRDVGEQSMLIMEQDMNAVNVVTPVPIMPTPITPRTTYPAFIMGVAPSLNLTPYPVAYINADASHAAIAGEAGADWNVYLWKAGDGSLAPLYSRPKGFGQALSISYDGGRILVGNGTALADQVVFNTATLAPISYSLSPDNLDLDLSTSALTGDGNSVFGTYTSLSNGVNTAGRWDYNGATYAQVDIYDSTTNTYFSGHPHAANRDGSVIGGSLIGPPGTAAYWVEDPLSGNRYAQYLINSPNPGYVHAITPDGQWLAGYSRIAGNELAFRVNTATSAQDNLNPPAGYTATWAGGISHNGRW